MQRKIVLRYVQVLICSSTVFLRFHPSRLYFNLFTSLLVPLQLQKLLSSLSNTSFFCLWYRYTCTLKLFVKIRRKRFLHSHLIRDSYKFCITIGNTRLGGIFISSITTKNDKWSCHQRIVKQRIFTVSYLMRLYVYRQLTIIRFLCFQRRKKETSPYIWTFTSCCTIYDKYIFWVLGLKWDLWEQARLSWLDPMEIALNVFSDYSI